MFGRHCLVTPHGTVRNGLNGPFKIKIPEYQNKNWMDQSGSNIYFDYLDFFFIGPFHLRAKTPQAERYNEDGDGDWIVFNVDVPHVR